MTVQESLVTPRKGRRRALRPVVRVVLTLAILGAGVAVLSDRLPGINDVWRALTHGDRRWILAAVAAEIFSIGMFAQQQRRLLRAFGVSMTVPRSDALAFARSAIAISLPAGSAISAGFAFRQYRVSGATRPVAATVMVLSGLASTLALVLLYLTGLLASALGPAWRYAAAHPRELWGGAVVLAAIVAVVCVGAALHSRRERPVHGRRRSVVEVLVAPIERRWPRAAKAANAVRETLTNIAAVPRRHWNTALGLAAVNWLADLACLYASVRAFDLEVSPAQLAALYLGVQVVRQIPVTPGGVGLIEASLLAGLVSAGGPQDTAAAAVLVYRLLSCWLIIPVGFLAWARLRRTPIAGGGNVGEPDTDEEPEAATAGAPPSPGTDPTAPDQPAPDQSAPGESAPGESAPGESAPGEATTQRADSDTPPDRPA